MAQYAIIKLAGKQYRVSEGDLFVVDRLEHDAEKEFSVADVLMVGDDSSQQIGTPILDKASVTLQVVEHGRGPKILVGKFRAKSRYRRVKGHRQLQTTLKVVKISA